MRHNSFLIAWLVCNIGLLWTTQASQVAAQNDSGFKYVEVKVADPDGQPVANASVEVKIDDMEFPMPTNDQGMISLNIPSGGNSRLQLHIKHEDYVADQAVWQGSEAIPAEITIRLEKGIMIGGVIHDEKGRPIEGVKVLSAAFLTTKANGILRTENELGVTDVEGKC